MESIKEKIEKLKNKITAIYLAYKRKDTPVLAKIFAGITVGYALSPIDFIPDFIPVLGYIDDMLILPIFIMICIKLIPVNIMKECEEQARDLWKNGKPKKWYYAIPIILIWLFIIGIILYNMEVLKWS